MNVQTYRAASIREALDLVRRELGSDAIILSTREVPGQRRFPWQRRQPIAEVVAGHAGQTAPLRHSTAAARRETPPAKHVAARSLETRQISGGTNPDRPAPVSARGLDPQPAPLPCVPSPLPRKGADDRFSGLIAQLGAMTHAPRIEVPDQHFHLYTQLIDADVDEEDARRLLLELKESATPNAARQAASPSAQLEALIESQIRCTGPIPVADGRRQVVALVGPTGVGKTTTIAKLAANFKLRERANVGLVTVDTYRVAAVEQLRTYAEIIDLPMHVVTSPCEMRDALQSLAAMDLVLIDTAGRSPRDELKIQELRSFLAEADVDQVHLVLSLASGIRSNVLTADRFRSVGVTSLLLTKLDEAAGPGAILSAARRIQLPISYLTTGQDVPDDIEAAQADRAARLILSAEAPATQ